MNHEIFLFNAKILLIKRFFSLQLLLGDPISFSLLSRIHLVSFHCNNLKQNNSSINLSKYLSKTQYSDEQDYFIKPTLQNQTLYDSLLK